MKFIFYVIVQPTILKENVFLKLIADKAPSFSTLNDSAKLIWLMTCEDNIVVNALADFIFLCFKMRKCAILQ